MYSRVASFVVKPYEVRKFCNTVAETADEIIVKQPGFVDYFIFISEQERRIVNVISLWRTKADADSYHKKIFPCAVERLAPLVDSGPTLQFFEVVISETSCFRLETNDVKVKLPNAS